RIIVTYRESEVADRCAPNNFGRGVADLASNPSSQLVCQERTHRRHFVGSAAGIIASESTSIRYSGRNSRSHTHPADTGWGEGTAAGAHAGNSPITCNGRRADILGGPHEMLGAAARRCQHAQYVLVNKCSLCRDVSHIPGLVGQRVERGLAGNEE